MTKWISLVCVLAVLTPGHAQDLLKRVKADYLAKDKQYDRLPTFGSSALSLAGYLSEHLPYPETAAAEGAEGEVLVQFTVARTGEVKDVKVLEGGREDLAQAVLATFARMPRWQPALRNEAPAETQLLFLVAFNRRNDPYLTQYKTDWLLSAGITSNAAKPEVKFLLEKDRKQRPSQKPLSI
jgi:TonB family protein